MAKNTLYFTHDYCSGEKLLFTDEKIKNKFFTDARKDVDYEISDFIVEEVKVDFDITNTNKFYAFVEFGGDENIYIFDNEENLQNFIKEYGIKFFEEQNYFPVKENNGEYFGDYQIYVFPDTNDFNFINPVYGEY